MIATISPIGTKHDEANALYSERSMNEQIL